MQTRKIAARIRARTGGGPRGGNRKERQESEEAEHLQNSNASKTIRIRIVQEGNTRSKQKFLHCRATTGDADEMPCATTLPKANGNGKRTLNSFFFGFVGIIVSECSG